MNNNSLEDLEARLAESVQQLNNLTSNLPNQEFFTNNFPKNRTASSSIFWLPFIIYTIFGGGLLVGGSILLSRQNKDSKGREILGQIESIEERIDKTKQSENQYVYLENKDIRMEFASSKIASDTISSYNLSGCRLESVYDSSNHLLLGRGQSYSFEFKLYGRPDIATLEVKHLSSASKGKAGITPVTLYINQNKVKRWRQLEAGYTTSKLSIEKYLCSGKNTVTFAYDPDEGTTYYWQKYVAIKSSNLCGKIQ